MSESLNLETVYTSPRFFGIETATPVQRAICRIAEGRPLEALAEHSDVRQAIGSDDALAILAPGTFRPRELDLLCAIRSGKSFFVAAHQFWSAMTARLEHLKAGEVPRYPVLSVNVRSAEATFNILAGVVVARPALRSLLIGEPGADSLFLRHPSGRAVECSVAAGVRAGANLVSVWLLGAAFEEYPRQASEAAGAIVNFDEQLRAAAGRVVEGGQILSVGSPWAPSGPAFERFSVGFGHPSPERVVIKATGPMMNPTWWTPARCEALQRSNPTAYTTDVLANFADPSAAFAQQSDVKAAIRTGGPVILPAQKGRRYACAMDPGGRGNHWTLVVLASYRDTEGYVRYEVALAKSWAGTTENPLSPWAVLSDIRSTVAPYGVQQIATDQFAADAIRDLGHRCGLNIFIRTTVPGNKREDAVPNPRIIHRNDMYEALGGLFVTRTISIPNDPTFIRDMLSIRRVVTRTGVTYDLPETPDRRHCDYAPAAALALSFFPQWPDALRAAAFRQKVGTLYESMALNNQFGPEEEARAQAIVAERQRTLFASAREATVLSEDWRAQAAREWEAYCARGAVKQ